MPEAWHAGTERWSGQEKAQELRWKLDRRRDSPVAEYLLIGMVQPPATRWTWPRAICYASGTSMDPAASYQFAGPWSIYFYAKNLLDTPHTFYQGTSNRPIQREFYGLTYLTGVRFEF